MPTCSAPTRNWDARSSSVTMPSSTTVKKPMPARTRFLATSLARPFMPRRRMFAVRILNEVRSLPTRRKDLYFSWASTPQRRIWRSYNAISSAVVSRQAWLSVLVTDLR